MGSFKIEGGQPLGGEIQPQGAKNEALQILCAVLLTAEPVLIHNIPEIIDVQKLIKLLQELGVKVSSKGANSYLFQADAVDLDYLSSDRFKEDGKGLRGSIMLVGPMLARFGVGSIPRPGGDKIGRRRLDTHFDGFIELGAAFEYDRENYFYTVRAEQLKGTDMLLDEASVTG
ncbi:MAG: UDP-N-acetylglucosamine 1-carboxyvinyltransferase, partial [Flavobacteriaceae bacterium]